MKKIIFFVLVLTTISCQKKETVKVDENSTDSTVVVIDHHTSQLSLDYIGTYHGVLPCADCEGIETTLTLIDENSFELTTLYLGKSKIPFENKGTYIWKEDGNTIVLEGIDSGANQFKVVENGLIQLDVDGNRITGNLAEKYILQKKSHMEELPPPPPPPAPETVKNLMTHPKSLINKDLIKKKWRLIELYGKSVENSDNVSKDMFIQLNNEGRYNAFAGCNNIMGKFELNDEKSLIKFSKGASTMMSCPDMTIEQEFKEMLEMVDNYSINRNNLSFNKARMAPLARFEVMK